MAVAPDDDSLVFQFHRASTSFASFADPDPSCLVVPSIEAVIVVDQGHHTKSILPRQTSYGRASSRVIGGRHARHKLCLHDVKCSHTSLPLHRSSHPRHPQKPQGRPLSFCGLDGRGPD